MNSLLHSTGELRAQEENNPSFVFSRLLLSGQWW
jgi:hypothetical protein